MVGPTTVSGFAGVGKQVFVPLKLSSSHCKALSVQ